MTLTTLLTPILAVFPVQSEGNGVRWDHLDDVCSTEQGQRSRFLGRQVVIIVLRGRQRKNRLVYSDVQNTDKRLLCEMTYRVTYVSGNLLTDRFA